MSPANDISGSIHPMAKYEGLSGSVQRYVRNPSSMKAFIIGFPGSGKSCLALDNPDGYLINMDMSSTTHPDPRCASWPTMDPASGSPIQNGQPFTMGWEHVEQQVKVLLGLASSNKPRPKTIYLDSLSSMCRLIRAWIPKNAAAIKISQEPKSMWNEVHGPSAYDWMYDRVVQVIETLSNAGYGVVLIGHVANEVLPVGENAHTIRISLTITDNFWKRLYDLFEFVAYVYKRNITEDTVVETTMPNGRVIPKKVSRKTTRFYLTPYKDELEGIMKRRVRFPQQLELPQTGGWSSFSDAYTKSPILSEDAEKETDTNASE